MDREAYALDYYVIPEELFTSEQEHALRFEDGEDCDQCTEGLKGDSEECGVGLCRRSANHKGRHVFIQPDRCPIHEPGEKTLPEVPWHPYKKPV